MLCRECEEIVKILQAVMGPENEICFVTIPYYSGVI